MTAQFVQSRKNPPVLIPLRDVDSQPLETLKKRLHVLQFLVFARRPYNPVEADEVTRISMRLWPERYPVSRRLGRGGFGLKPRRRARLTADELGTLNVELLA